MFRIGVRLSHGEIRVPMTVNNAELRFAFDAGAKVSYIVPEMTNGLISAGETEDFYPGYERFKVSLYDMEANVAGNTFPVRFGNLPEELETTLLKVTGLDGIIGFDLFDNFTVCIDCGNKKVCLSRH